jgi:hypothetical protein
LQSLQRGIPQVMCILESTGRDKHISETVGYYADEILDLPSPPRGTIEEVPEDNGTEHLQKQGKALRIYCLQN